MPRRPRPADARPARVSIVLADWCPHCVPLSDVRARRLARQLRVPYRRLDIERRAEVRVADRIVRAHGDWAPDYLIPQVFLEWTDGRVDHLFTGFSEQVARTRQGWTDLFRSAWLRRLRAGGPR